MISLTDSMPGARYFHRVLLSDLAKWTVLGWECHAHENFYEHVPGRGAAVLIEWQTEDSSAKPPTP